MTPNVHRKRATIFVGIISAIVLLVVFIVVLWILQGKGTFTSSERKSNVTEHADRIERTMLSQPKDVNASTKNVTLDNNPNVQFVTPWKISPQPLHHHDLIYDQMHNETTGSASRYHSGHFRHKTAEIWDPYPEYEIEAFGKTLHLNLVHNDDVPKKIHITHIYENYSRIIEHDPNLAGCFYKGTIKGDVNSSVSVSLCHGMTGHIHTSTGNYYITPAENSSEYSIMTLKHKMIKESYRPDESYGDNSNISHCEEKIIIDDEFLPESDTSRERSKRELLFFDEVDGYEEPSYEAYTMENRRWVRGVSHSQRYSASARTKRTDHEYFIEVLVVADKKMLEYHGNNDILIQYILTLMSHVGILFKDATVGNPITLVVVHISILNDTEFTHNKSDQMLKSFCEWQRDHNVHIHHDAAILLTRNLICKNLTSGVCHTLGIAEVGGMCSETSSCAIVKDNGLSTSYTIAHEMGHLLNMRHDDHHKCSKYNEGGKANIMSKVLHNDTKPWQWSACSRHYLTEFLDSPRASCLIGKPKEVESKNRKLNLTETLPGEKFEVNRQCELEFGSGSKICSFMPKCSSLWCTSEAGEENGCRTQHMPWADGTRCDYTSWCHHGRCIKMDRQSLAPRDGSWGLWQPWGECSRTCGGGIRISRRECNRPPPTNGGSYCKGHSTKYESCNTEDCGTDALDFREAQCAEFDGDTKGITGLTPHVKWVPKYGIVDEHDLCRLFCRVKGANEYYRLKDKVLDGTKCSINSFDICVNGKCLPGGCDNKLNSTQSLDECGVCNGDNSTCQEVHGTYNHSARGYNMVARIPKGSSNLVIEQRGHNGNGRDDNYLVLADGETGGFVLNGNFIISSWKRDLVYGGLTIAYSGSDIQTELLTTPKNYKLTKDLLLEVLTVTGVPPDITYRFTINKEKAPKFGWHFYDDNWTECDSICKGEQEMKPICLDLVTYAQAPASNCFDLFKDSLEKKRPCNIHCTLAWNITKSGYCSQQCGIGWQDINYNCMRINSNVPDNAYQKIEQAVDDKHCSNLPTPSPREPCKGLCDATHWQYSPWSECSKTCGSGTKIRTAKCVDSRNNTIDDSHCRTKKKYVKHYCNTNRCPVWAYGNWTRCSQQYGKGYKTKRYYCSLNNRVTDDDKCNSNDLKIPTEECVEVPCNWFIGNWSTCNASCGEAVRVRVVECRAGTMKIDDDSCWDHPKPKNTTDCKTLPCKVVENTRTPNYNNEILNYINYSNDTDNQWEAGEWGECSKSCGGGIKLRLVACRNVIAKNTTTLCDVDQKPKDQSRCNDFDCPRWRTGDWTKCSKTCVKSRQVSCFDRLGYNVVNDSLCKTTKPETVQKCDPRECNQSNRFHGNQNRKTVRFRWKKTAWGPCSNFCGKGTRTRKVTCRDIPGNVTVVDGLCQGLAKPKHLRFCQHYSKLNCSFTWVDGPWSKCSRTCGEGVRYRNVTCQRVFPGGVIQEGVINHYRRCGPHPMPPTQERCTEKNCNDPYTWGPDAWSKCPETCGVKGFQIRRLHCLNARGQRTAKKFCRRIRRPERKRRCPLVYCSSCKQIQMRMKTKQNKEYILKLHGKMAPVYCYKMDTGSPEEFISLQGGKENYAQYYDARRGMLSQTSFWKIRLDIETMHIITNDFTFSETNGTQQYYAQAGTNYQEIDRYLFFFIDMSDTVFRLSRNVRWICTERANDKYIKFTDGQIVRGMCEPTCGTCLPDPEYGLPVEIT